MISMIFILLLLARVFRLSEQACAINKKYSKLKCEEIKIILDYHNECRNEVALGKTKLPKSKNMWQLKWDKDLAKVAQKYANKCIFEHNKSRPPNTGENLSWSATSKDVRADLKYLVKLWWDEIEFYDLEGEFDLHKTGHFTQLVWGDTQYVGCGVTYYKDVTNLKNPFQTLLVCNYKPAGNVQGHKPYHMVEDNVCERGIESKMFTGLCAQDKEQAEGKYVPCSGYKIQPTAIFFIFCLLYGLRSL